MKGLGLDVFLPPTFNIETGKFDEPKLLNPVTGQVVDVDEADIFELALMRGQRVGKLQDLESKENVRAHQDSYSKTGQKHSKKDYERVNKMSLMEIVNLSKEERIRKEF